MGHLRDVALAVALAVDIVVARAGGRADTLRSAAFWSGVWITVGLLFSAWVAVRFGGAAGLTYLTAMRWRNRSPSTTFSSSPSFFALTVGRGTTAPARGGHLRALHWPDSALHPHHPG